MAAVEAENSLQPAGRGNRHGRRADERTWRTLDHSSCEHVVIDSARELLFSAPLSTDPSPTPGRAFCLLHLTTTTNAPYRRHFKINHAATHQLEHLLE